MRRVQTVLGDLNDALILVAFLEGRIDDRESRGDERKVLRRVHARAVTTCARSSSTRTERVPKDLRVLAVVADREPGSRKPPRPRAGVQAVT